MAEIAVIGAGKIGGILARKWAASGHAVTIGARDPNKPSLKELAERIGVRTALIVDAVRAAEVVVFAIPGVVMAETASALGADLDGKLLIDATNNVGAEDHQQPGGHQGGRSRGLLLSGVQHAWVGAVRSANRRRRAGRPVLLRARRR